MNQDTTFNAPSTLPRAPLVEGLPILGNSLGFLRDTTGLLDSLYRQYRPIFRIRAGWNEFTVIAGSEGKEFLVRGGAEGYLTREAFFRPVAEQLGNADFVLGVSGERHTRLRKLLSIAYSRQIASPFVPRFIECVRRYLRPFRAGDVLSVVGHVPAMAFEQYSQVVAGEAMTHLWRDMNRVVTFNMNVGGRTLPPIAYKYPIYQRSRRKVLQALWNIVEERRRHGAVPGAPTTIIDTLLSQRDQSGASLSDDEAVCYAMYGYAGSCAYMGRLISFLLYELLRHPEQLERVRQEVQAAFATGIRNAVDVRSMRRLLAVYHESMRLHPVSQGLPFIASESFEYRGYHVRKGDQVVFSQIPMFFEDPPFPQPQTFIPERCMAPRSEHRRGGCFNPFGMGQRTCTAGGLVELMAMTQVATLIHEFDLAFAKADYQPRIIVFPLPSPDRRFKIRLGERRAPKAHAVHIVESRLVAYFQSDDETGMQALLQNAERRVYGPGEVIIQQGDKPDFFYTICSGQVEVLKQDEGEVAIHLAMIGKGGFFGEQGLFYDQPRNATVRVSQAGPAELIAVSRDDFERMIAEHDFIAEEIASLLRKRSLTQTLSQTMPNFELAAIAHALPEFTTERVGVGEVIIRQGEPPDRFYIIVSGQVSVFVESPPAEDQLVNVLGPGAFFGEIGLLLGSPRTASVRASGEDDGEVVLMSIGADGFNQLLKRPDGVRVDLVLAMGERLLRDAT